MNAIPKSAGGASAQDGEQLVRLVRECVIAGIARRAMLLRLSRLPPEFARPHHLRLAREALDPLTAADRARLFALANGDLAVVWRGDAAAAVEAVTAEIAQLFADGATPVDIAALIVPLALPEQAATILDAVADSRPASVIAASAASGEPLDPASLAALEASLMRADVASFARRKQICERMDDGRFVLRWEKRFLSVRDLAMTLAPDRAAQADPWLFRRLTRSLDRRMLALLAAPQELKDAGPFSLNLNVGSILSPEFLRFDAALPGPLRGRVALELLPADTMADPAAFIFARDFARARGYRLLLRGLTADLLPTFPRERMGVDLLQIRWSSDLAAVGAEILGEHGSHIVLARADTEAAVAWGVSRGVRLYQRVR